MVGFDVVGSAWLLVVVIVILVVVLYLAKGIYLIRENEVGIQTRKFWGQRMPQGQVIARKGQIGVQAATLMPGLYYRVPLLWSVQKAPVYEVGEDEIATIEAIDGRPLPPGRRLGDAVECNSFQDAEAFLQNGGCKGPQIAFLRPGKYRLNIRAFYTKKGKATIIETGFVGRITAQDGRPLSAKYVVAPLPLKTPDDTWKKARDHAGYQDGQAFIDSGGYRGPQLEVQQPGTYYVNTELFGVEKNPIFEVPPGFVAVVRSNVGAELDRPPEQPTPVSSDPKFEETVTAEVEHLLTNDKSTRGIWRNPIAPGKYPLNTLAYSTYLVPTSAIMVDWAASDRLTAPRMATTPTQGTGPGSSSFRFASDGDDDQKPKPGQATASDYNYTTDPTLIGKAFFAFSQLKVISKDGFELEVDVKMIIRIQPENAAFIIARFGSVFNLIQQIVHPLIDAEFRNNAGEKKALEFVQSRSALQAEALATARDKFKVYLIEAQGLLISYIGVDAALLKTQSEREIAVQQQAQFVEQAKAAEQSIAVREKQAMADLQPKVVGAKLEVAIQKDLADARANEADGQKRATVAIAEGDSQAITLRGNGEASKTRAVGMAAADAYRAQTGVLGPERTALLKALDEIASGKVVITPDIVVNSGSEGAAGATIMTWLLSQLQGARLPKPDPSASPPTTTEVAPTEPAPEGHSDSS